MEFGKREKWDRLGLWTVNLMIALYGISMVYLFYQQTQWVDGAVYESDLPAHIKMIVEDGWYYSLTAFVYQALFMLPHGELWIAVFLSLCGVGAVYITYLILIQLDNTYSRWLYAGEALVLNLVMGCYIKGIADGRYIGMESASIWHNSTYIVMKVVGLACLLYYRKLVDTYKAGLCVKDWLLFTLLLILCTGIKPSFLLVFAPMMGLFLLGDLWQGISFRRVFFFGLTVIPSLLVIILQNAILFGGHTGNGWEIKPGYALGLHSGYPMLAAVLSILFPLMVLCFHIRDLKTDRCFLGAWLMAGFGFLELFLFCETGGRASDGNFMWGYSFTILLIFLVSLLKWSQDTRQIYRNQQRSWLSLAYILTSALVLCYHLYCGIYFYIHLVQGVSYWMWD